MRHSVFCLLARYADDRFNVFDAAIVVVSLIELVVTPPALLGGTSSDTGGALSALRTFRLLRVFKLAKNWTSLRLLLSTILRTLIHVGNFVLLLLLFMYIFALIGMQVSRVVAAVRHSVCVGSTHRALCSLQLFANRFRFDPVTNEALTVLDPGYQDAPVPRAHFDNLLRAFVTIFQVLTAENWNNVMYDGRRSAGTWANL